MLIKYEERSFFQLVGVTRLENLSVYVGFPIQGPIYFEGRTKSDIPVIFKSVCETHQLIPSRESFSCDKSKKKNSFTK